MHSIEISRLGWLIFLPVAVTRVEALEIGRLQQGWHEGYQKNVVCQFHVDFPDTVTRHLVSVRSVWYRWAGRLCCRVLGVQMAKSRLVQETP